MKALLLQTATVLFLTTAQNPNVCPSLPQVQQVGRLGIMFLQRFHAAFLLSISTSSTSCGGLETILAGDDSDPIKSLREMKLVLDAIGLGLEPTFHYLTSQQPTFDEFEDWIEQHSAVPLTSQNLTILRLNNALTGKEPPEQYQQLIQEIEAMPNVLSEEDLVFWQEQGYVVLHDAVSQEQLQNTAGAVWDFVGSNPDDPDSWCMAASRLTNTRVPLFDNPYFIQNRASKRIHKAYSQLWGTADLWMSIDQASFNPPGCPFLGPHLHWDAALRPPLPMSTQGLLYLVDVQEDQGAFTLVPGFHRKVDDFLWEVAAHGEHPMDRDLHALGSKPIAGKAGDFIIWDHRLPHGGSPNVASEPRLVQYMNMLPADICAHQPETLPQQSCNAYGQCSVGECSRSS